VPLVYRFVAWLFRVPPRYKSWCVSFDSLAVPDVNTCEHPENWIDHKAGALQDDKYRPSVSCSFGQGIALYLVVLELFIMRSISWWPTLIFPAVVRVTDLQSRQGRNWLVPPFLLRDLPSSEITHGMSSILQFLEGMCVGILLQATMFARRYGNARREAPRSHWGMDRPAVNWKQRDLRPQR